MTPAQKAGLVIGQKYKVINGDDAGKMVTFSYDDGSVIPKFFVDGIENYKSIENIEIPSKTFHFKNPPYEIYLSVGKPMTTDQVTRILAIIQEGDK